MRNPESALARLRVPPVEDLLGMTSPNLDAGDSPFSRAEVEKFVDYCASAVRDAPEVVPPPGAHGLTLEVAQTLGLRDEIYHRTERDSKGQPARARVNGKLKTWKTHPGVFEVPMKYGFKSRDAFNIVGGPVDVVGLFSPGKWSDPRSWSTLPDGGRGWVTVDAVTALLSTEGEVSDHGHTQEWELMRLVLKHMEVRGEYRPHATRMGTFSPAVTPALREEDWAPEALDLWRGACRDGGWTEALDTFESPRRQLVEHVFFVYPSIRWGL